MSVQDRNDQAVNLLRADMAYPGEIHIGHIDADAGAVAAFTFPPAGALPTNYRHLKLIVSARSTRAAAADTLKLNLSGGVGANYDRQIVYGLAAAAGASEALNQTYFDLVGQWPAANALASLFGTAVIWIYDYNNANKKPVITAEMLLANNVTTGTMYAMGVGGIYNVAGAVTTLALAFANGNLDQYSEADLFGVGQR